MDEKELSRIMKEFKTMRQILNPSNVESFIKWTLDIIPKVTQRSIEILAENEALRKEVETLRKKEQQRGTG